MQNSCSYILLQDVYYIYSHFAWSLWNFKTVMTIFIPLCLELCNCVLVSWFGRTKFSVQADFRVYWMDHLPIVKLHNNQDESENSQNLYTYSVFYFFSNLRDTSFLIISKFFFFQSVFKMLPEASASKCICLKRLIKTSFEESSNNLLLCECSVPKVFFIEDICSFLVLYWISSSSVTLTI